MRTDRLGDGDLGGWQDVNATRATASVLGVLVGISGLDHGLFETLQGNTPTAGLIVSAIGPLQRMWVYGTEEAFTLVPNFFATGILAMTIGLLVIVWSIAFIGRRNGRSIFLLLAVLLFLVGGGVAQAGLAGLCWAVCGRIDNPPTWCRKLLPADVAGRVAWLWLACLVASVAMFALAVEIAIWGVVPGVSDPDNARMVCWSALGVMLAFLLVAIVAGFAHDIERQADARAQ